MHNGTFGIMMIIFLSDRWTIQTIKTYSSHLNAIQTCLLRTSSVTNISISKFILSRNFSYRFSHIARTLKALSSSIKTSLRIDGDGLLALQFLMPGPRNRAVDERRGGYIEFRVRLLKKVRKTFKHSQYLHRLVHSVG